MVKRKFLEFLFKIAQVRPKTLFLGNFFFRWAQTFCKHYALIISDIVMQFFSTHERRNREKNVRDRFLNFVTWSAEEPDKVENYRFLQNYSMDFDKNQAAWSLFDTLSAENIKSAKIKIRKNGFFENFAYLHM